MTTSSRRSLGPTVIGVMNRGMAATANAGRVRLAVAAGEPWDELVGRCVADGLAGIECLAGIPGSTGATPIQNVGAYGQQVADAILSVRAYDRVARQVVELGGSECGFAYRSSRFRRCARFVVLGVTFELGAPRSRARFATRNSAARWRSSCKRGRR